MPWEYFVSEPVRRQLQCAGLHPFDALWSLEADWVEAPNMERQGWSGVCRLVVTPPEAAPWIAYLKRQENHGYRSLGNPFRYRPTAYREFQGLRAMQTAGIRVPEVLYYGERRSGQALQALLMTREVPRSLSLEAYLEMADQRPRDEVRRLVQDTADLIGRLHRCHFQHCALYGKHVLIRDFMPDPAESDVARDRPQPVLIDVEKARRRPLRIGIALKDLSQFRRRTPWPEALWEMFLARYVAVCGIPRLKPFLARQIRRRVRRKQPRKRTA
jgi:hypothetical protein